MTKCRAEKTPEKFSGALSSNEKNQAALSFKYVRTMSRPMNARQAIARTVSSVLSCFLNMLLLLSEEKLENIIPVYPQTRLKTRNSGGDTFEDYPKVFLVHAGCYLDVRDFFVFGPGRRGIRGPFS